MLVDKRKVSTVQAVFAELHGIAKAKQLCSVQQQQDGLSAQILFANAESLHPTKELQYVYVNRHPVLGTPIHKLLNRTYKFAKEELAAQWEREEGVKMLCVGGQQ